MGVLKRSQLSAATIEDPIGFTPEALGPIDSKAVGFPFTLANNLSVLFDGADEYATAGSHPEHYFDVSDPFTIACWLKTSTALATFISRLSFIGGYLFFTASGQLQFTMEDTAGNSMSTDETALPSMNDDTWYFVVVTYDGGGVGAGVDFYIDAVHGTTNVSDDSLATGIDPAGELQFGQFFGGLFNYAGNLDEIMIFGTALNQAEVTTLYNLGVPLDPLTTILAANTVGWWRMGDGDTFPTLQDQTTNVRDATMINMEAGDIEADTP